MLMDVGRYEEGSYSFTHGLPSSVESRIVEDCLHQ